MFRPEEMVKIRIYAVSSKLEPLIKKLHELGLLHIEEVDINKLKKGIPGEKYDLFAEMLNKVRVLAKTFKIKKKGNLLPINKIIEVFEEIKTVSERVESINREILRIKDERDKLSDNLKDIKLLKEAGLIYDKLPKGWRVEAFKVDEKDVKNVEEEILLSYDNVVTDTKKLGNKFIFIVAIKDGNLSKIYSNYDVEPIFTPQKSLKRAEDEILDKIKNLDKELNALKKELESIKKRYKEKIADLYYTLSIYTERERIVAKFGRSALFTVIEGWLPKNKLNEFKEKLKEFDKEVYIEEIHTHEVPPTLLKNPHIAKPFEFLVKFTSLPRGDELDPSIIYLFTVPFLYGMIIGDVIYSIMAFIFADYLQKKIKHPYIKGFTDIWKIGSIGGIFWGLLFDEWMGASHAYWLNVIGKFIGLSFEPLYHPFIHRMHQITLLILATVIVGIVHLCLGFLLGAIKEWKHSKIHALGKLAWIPLIIGGAITVSGLLFNAIPKDIANISLYITIISALVMVAIEKVAGLFEIPGVLGNIFSYARIAAVGVVGVVIAEMINEFFTPSDIGGLIMFPLLIFLHFSNALLAMFESLIHGGRLNLVEFGSKFFSGGGKEYQPFMLKGGE